VPASSQPPASLSVAGTCRVLGSDDLTGLVSGTITQLPEGNPATLCAYHVAASPVPFDVVLRLEDAFASLDEVHTALPGGTTGPAPADLYWVDDVGTGWFVAGGKLYAVQVLGDIDRAMASSVASSVANLVLPRL
jgi:hypothetical protein